MEVQVFGVMKSADTRKALRFFSERRIKTHFVDLNQRAASLGELRRFADRFGAQALLDREGMEFGRLGLGAASVSEAGWLDRLVLYPLLLRMPLVRSGKLLTIGLDEAAWVSWVADASGKSA